MAGPAQYNRGNVFSGARARFSMNGETIGYATNCSGSEEIEYVPIEVLDHIEVVEWVPVSYRVTFTASRVRLIGASSGTAGSFRGGNFNGRPLLANLGADDVQHRTNIFALEPFDATIEDTQSRQIFMQLQQVNIASHNWALTPRGIVGEDIIFVATRMKDEIEMAP